MKINSLRGDLTDISAKKAALSTRLLMLVAGKRFGFAKWCVTLARLCLALLVQCDNISAIALMMNHDMITVLPLSIQTLCELHRHVASPNDITFSIRRLHSKHLDRAQAVVSTNLPSYSASFVKPVLTNAFVWILSGDTVHRGPNVTMSSIVGDWIRLDARKVHSSTEASASFFKIKWNIFWILWYRKYFNR